MLSLAALTLAKVCPQWGARVQLLIQTQPPATPPRPRGSMRRGGHAGSSYIHALSITMGAPPVGYGKRIPGVPHKSWQAHMPEKPSSLEGCLFRARRFLRSRQLRMSLGLGMGWELLLNPPVGTSYLNDWGPIDEGHRQDLCPPNTWERPREFCGFTPRSSLN